MSDPTHLDTDSFPSRTLGSLCNTSPSQHEQPLPKVKKTSEAELTHYGTTHVDRDALG